MGTQKTNEATLEQTWFDTASRCRASGMILSRPQVESLITLAPQSLEVNADSTLFEYGAMMAEWNWCNFDPIGSSVARSEADQEAMQNRLLDFAETITEPATADDLYTYLMGHLSFTPELNQHDNTPAAALEMTHA